MRKEFRCLLLYIIISIFILNLVSAVAISGRYSERVPLEVYPGEIKTITFILQNMAGDSDVKFRGNITEGASIIGFVDENTEYLVPLGSNNISVEIKVVIPEDTSVGSEYQARVEFEPVAIDTEEEAEGTGASVVIGLSRSFNVIIIETPEALKEEISIWWVILGIVLVGAIIAVIWFIVRSRREKEMIESVDLTKPIK